MLALKDLISTPLYSNLNVIIHPQLNNLFSMHTTLSNQINDQNISSSDDSNFENEDHVTCAPIDSMIHNFLDASKINDYEKIIYSIVPSRYFHPLGLLKDNHLKELDFPILFYGHPQSLIISKILSYQQIAQWELLHKSKDFSTNISNLFFKVLKFSIQKIIGSGWVFIRKGKINCKSLKAFKV
jgi:hypothetical protein